MTAISWHPHTGSRAGAPRLTVAKRIRPDHDVVADLVAAGFGGVPADDVEVHLKARADEVVRWLVLCAEPASCRRPANYQTDEARGHCAQTRRHAVELAGDPSRHRPPRRLVVRPSYGYSGRAYPALPAVARVSPGVLFLVTLKMPADPSVTGDSYPRISRYLRYKTAPPVTLADWTDELVHLAAHEARHVHQFRHGLRRSEIDAEKWAHAQLSAYRRDRDFNAEGIDVLKA